MPFLLISHVGDQVFRVVLSDFSTSDSDGTSNYVPKKEGQQVEEASCGWRHRSHCFSEAYQGCPPRWQQDCGEPIRCNSSPFKQVRCGIWRKDYPTGEDWASPRGVAGQETSGSSCPP